MGTRLIIKTLRVFFTLTVLVLTASMARELKAESVTFDFSATVNSAINTSILTGGAIPVPSVINGSFTFDSTAVDQNPVSPDQGIYHYSSPPNGMIAQAGTNVFQTDPANVDFTIDVVDGTAALSIDSYQASSRHNTFPLPTGTAVDPFSTFSVLLFNQADQEDIIFGDDLPLLPPAIPNTPDNAQLVIRATPVPQNPNGDPLFYISATIDTLTLHQPPTVESTVQDLKNFVTGLPTSSLKNSNMMGALLNKIDALKTTGTGMKEKLTNDILAKGNGCGTVPDNNDWIKDCTAQLEFQEYVQAILELL